MTAAPLHVAQRDELRTLIDYFTRAVEQARKTGRPVLVSVSTVAEPLDPVALYEVARARGDDAVFWHVPWQDTVLVGAGTAWTVTGDGANRFAHVSSRWRELVKDAVHVVDDALVDGLGDAVGDAVTAGGRLFGAAQPGPSSDDLSAGGLETGSWAADEDVGPIYPPDEPGTSGPMPGPVLLGGFAFDAGSATGPWTAFGDGRLDLPRVMYGDVGGRVWVTVNTMVVGEADAVAAAQAVLEKRELFVSSVADGGQPVDAAEVSGRDEGRTGHGEAVVEDVQPRQQWLQAVEEVAGAIRARVVDKAVLARSVRMKAPQRFDIGTALRYLQQHYPECYIFAIGQGDDCFLGATPERIVYKKHGSVRVACMAGSLGRGATPEDDQKLGRQLLTDSKNMDEHLIVLRSILEALEPVCTDVSAGRTGLRKLANVQHLYTPVTARAGGDVDVLALVERVHPTPAIGGYPRAEALALIREKENLDRGWYAGPVGWMDGAGDGEFAVGLRSALVKGDTALLFAGCGIMGDSVPESEYEESVLKLRPMRAALGAGQ